VIWALETLLLAAHLVCVNVAAGGPVVAAWLDWKRVRGDAAASHAARWLAGWSVAGLVAGGALGVLIGWLKWNADYRALWAGPLSYKLHWAALEMLFSLVLLVGWWLWLPRTAGGSRQAMWVRGTIALAAATNLLYHFPILFSVAARLYDTGQSAGEPMRGAEFRQQMLLAESPALAVHVVLASIAVAGTMLLLLAMQRRQGGEADAQRLAVWGGRWALAPTLAQVPVGLWTLLTLPMAAQSALMGTDGAATLLFIAALLAAFWLMRELASLSLGETAPATIVRAVASMLITIVLMTAALQATRAMPRTAQRAAPDKSVLVSTAQLHHPASRPAR
jgi:hypothetical protein